MSCQSWAARKVHTIPKKIKSRCDVTGQTAKVLTQEQARIKPLGLDHLMLVNLERDVEDPSKLKGTAEATGETRQNQISFDPLVATLLTLLLSSTVMHRHDQDQEPPALFH